MKNATMKSKYKALSIITFLMAGTTGFSQVVNRTLTNDYDPDKHKIIPDKVFEIGLPLLFLFLIANTLVAILKNRAESKLKEKAIDKGISEATLIALFAEDKKLNRMVYVKWFLILAALGVSLIIIQLIGNYLKTNTGYLAIGIVTIFQSIAFIIYYQVIKNR
jgi:hypothetical protein